MNETNFGSSFLKGIKVSEDKEKNRRAIFNLIEEMSNQIKKASENKINIEIIKDTEFNLVNTPIGAVVARVMAPKTRVSRASVSALETIKEITGTNPDHLNYVLAIVDDKFHIKLTDFIFDPQAFPCRFKIDGSDVVSHDLFSLERNLHKLLSSAHAGDCFRRFMK